MSTPIIATLCALIALAAGLVAGFLYRQNVTEKKIGRTEAFAKNLFDEKYQVDRNVACTVCTRVFVDPGRPRIVGLRFGQSF